MMKKKRIVVISFVLVAVLAMGVGFATVADTLNISGRAGFRASNVVTEDVANAIQFDQSYTPVLNNNGLSDAILTTFSAQVTGLNAADMTVAFNGTTAMNEYAATVTYKVDYLNNKLDLPDVELAVDAAVLDGTVPNDDFEITTLFTSDAEGQVAVDSFAPGTSGYVTVTVKYTVPDPQPTEVVAGTISIALHFNVPD